MLMSGLFYKTPKVNFQHISDIKILIVHERFYITKEQLFHIIEFINIVLQGGVSFLNVM